MAFGKKLDSRLSALTRASRAQIADGPSAMSMARKRVKRAEDRQSTYKFGRVRWQGGGDLACIVQDMSRGGARVKLQGAYVLPPTVVLSIAEMAFRRECQVRWQDNDVAGLAFQQ